MLSVIPTTQEDRMGRALQEAVSVGLPLLLGGLSHIVVIKCRVLQKWAIPLDVVIRTHGLFGKNKTVRGVVIMVLATAIWAVLCPYGGIRLERHAVDNTVLLGAVLGVGYCLGELPNSFLKRRMGIAPGHGGVGVVGAGFWLVDQADGPSGAASLAVLCGWISWHGAGMLIVIALVVHPLVAMLMFSLRLKSRIG